ncbi:polysaccharide biosynthesis PFTS motif protein [Methanolobus vulcani]|uniref:Polysaccharide biosynthesis PFTS motif protein n=1 Tax=Methanolobus vulcani TaxID=38026 RepID=A0A7Z7AVI4_9EURY|nr:polysaccharide biosynthesis PFTS motif protein [Methanolobus vulcani]SDF57957.1 polysaccharide biosynthesis PFTS motif protein [Methanolobus vulcani]
MKNDEKKVVFFENINISFYKTCVSYLNNGYIVYFFKIDNSFLTKSPIRNNLDNRKLINISELSFDYSLFTKAAFFSHKNLDSVFERYLTSPLIRYVSNLYDSSKVVDVYRKELMGVLNTVYTMELKINAIIENSVEVVIFCPVNNYCLHSSEFSLLSGKVHVKAFNNRSVLLTRLQSKMKNIVLLFYPFYILFNKVKPLPSKKKDVKEIRIGLNANLPGFFGFNHHYIGYIIDEIYGLPKSEVLFIDETFEAQNSVDFRKYGYMHTDFRNKRERISKTFASKIISEFIPVWLFCLRRAYKEEDFIIKSTRIILVDYIKWNMFLDSYSIEKHITVLLPDNISKTLLLEKKGVKTFYIYPDNYAGDYHIAQDDSLPNSVFYIFMHVNHAIIFGNKVERFFNVNRNSINHYHKVGVLASQKVRELKEGLIDSDLFPINKKKELPEKIVAVFDTSFVDYGPLKVKDGIKFGEDILYLLQDFPEIGVIFKEKKFLSETPELAPIYEQLEKHERCYVVRKSKEEIHFSYEVIASADLVISAAYTSTTAEALASRTKAVYYDVAGTDIDEKYYFNSFPNLVAHNYSDLKRLVNYWLYEVDIKQFNNFLETYVKGEIDPYLDCKAIDRLHQILKN